MATNSHIIIFSIKVNIIQKKERRVYSKINRNGTFTATTAIIYPCYTYIY